MRVYYYEDDKAKVEVSIARYRFSLPFVQDKSVLDIGCGARRGPLILSEKAKKVIGSDISLEAIDYCQKNFKNENINYLVSDAASLPFKSHSFDAVSSFEVIEHLDDYRLYLKEAQRILKDWGKLIVSTPNRLVVSPNGILSNPDHRREFSLDEFKAVLNGFFSEVTIYGQFPSQRVKKLEENRRNNLKRVERMPKIFGKLYPQRFKEKTLKIYHELSARFLKGLDTKKVGDEDFSFERENLSEARYFFAICSK